jgi:hypothetical protein
MTTPSGPELDPGPVPDEQPTAPSRASVIATIHGVADWLAANPDVPTPDGLTLRRVFSVDDEIDEATRVTAVLAVAAGHHVRPYETSHDVWAILPVCQPERGHALRASYMLRADLDAPKSAGRYVR